MMIVEKRIPVFFKNMYQTSPIFQLEAFISREIGIFGNIFLVMLQKLKRGDVVRIKLRKFGNFLIYKKLKKFPIFFGPKIPE